MEKIRHLEHALIRSRRLPALLIALALLVLAGVVVFAALQARSRIRAQIVGRDGAVLYAVALWHYAEDVKDGLAGPTLSVGDPLSIALKSSQLRGVLGVRLFDPNGEYMESFPAYVIESELADDELRVLKKLQPVNRFHPHAEMAALFYPEDTAPTGTIPLLEVSVPLHPDSESGLAGIAQFLVEGTSIAADFARLDRLLALQAGLAFGAGGGILSAALVWAFRRLRRAQKLLTERTEDLVRANQELAMIAKTSALGAVAAHLIHGLKNPLAGLQNFVTARGSATEAAGEGDWQQAVASTQRMQAMIQQVIGVLREEQTGTAYDVTLAELEQIVRNRVQPQARDRGVNFTAMVEADAALPNRVANLVALILANLAENAVQATPSGKAVMLAARRADGRIVFEVRDEGGGFPADIPLFMPCRSTRVGGTGIGLALCKQLANHLDAELELASSTSTGCVFALKLPAAVGREKPTATMARL
jgi:signal transduction histidine kinase